MIGITAITVVRAAVKEKDSTPSDQSDSKTGLALTSDIFYTI